MIKKVLYSLVVSCIAFTAVLFVAPSVTANGSIVNDKSPFIDAEDSGGAKDVNLLGTDKQQKDSLVNIVKGWINWILGILALVALIILIYGGFLMLTAAGAEDKFNKGWTILKQAAIGLLVIGVAWFIVSIIFWLINVAAKNPGAAGTEQSGG